MKEFHTHTKFRQKCKQFFSIRPEFELFKHKEKNIKTLNKFYFPSVLLPEVLINTGFEIKNVQDRHIVFLWNRQTSNQNRPKIYQKK